MASVNSVRAYVAIACLALGCHRAVHGACGSASPVAKLGHGPGWYAKGNFSRVGHECFFTDSPASPPTSYECGVVLIGVAPGASANELAPVLREISARVTRDRTERDQGWMELQVPSGTEREAIIRLYDHPCVKFAQLALNEMTRFDRERLTPPPPSDQEAFPYRAMSATRQDR